MNKEQVIFKNCLSAKDVSEYLNISLSNAYDLMNRKEFPSFRVDCGRGKGALRVRFVELIDWINTKTNEPKYWEKH